MKAKVYLLFRLCIFSFVVTAKEPDSTRKYKFDISGSFFAQNFSRDENGQVTFQVPDYLRQRRPTEPAVANMWGLNSNDYVTDNPMGHGPMFFGAHAWYYPVKALELYGSLTIDHRGMSWGPYNTDNIAWLPRFYANYRDKFQVRDGRDSLIFFGQVGYFEDYRNYEGLTLYNVDLQGIEGGLQFKKVQLKASQHGDLIRGFGLGIDGVVDLQLGFIGLDVGRKWSADVKLGTQNMLGFPTTGDDQRIYSLSAGLYKENTRLYIESGYRHTAFSPILNMAFLGGIGNKLSHRRLKADIRLEYRYYGGGFNHQFRNEEATHFRNVNRPTGANLIGDMVYPLSFFGRPFSQWAVFTEYDKQWVQGITAYGSLSYNWYRSAFVFCDFDFNYISAEGEEGFIYPFYNSGIKAHLATGTFASISITNRTMNLDKHYTTYYLTSRPGYQFQLTRTLQGGKTSTRSLP